jgi:hypothetical protein
MYIEFIEMQTMNFTIKTSHPKNKSLTFNGKIKDDFHYFL